MLLSREDKDLGVASHAPPGSQASPRGEAKDSALLPSRDADFEYMADLCRQHPQAAIGETGLDYRLLLCRPWVAQSSILVAIESWGLRSSHCRAKETSSRPVSRT